MADGSVIAGQYLGGTVSTIVGSTLVVQSGLKWRRLNPQQVVEWREVPYEPRSNRITTIGKAVAGAVAPRVLSKAASAAVGAALESNTPPRHVRVDWSDGKQSLIELPEALFTHLALVLENRRAPDEVPEPVGADANAIIDTAPPTVSEQAMALVSDIVRDRFSKLSTNEPADIDSSHNVPAQIAALAELRDQGILTEAEFAAKKSELLSRL